MAISIYRSLILSLYSLSSYCLLLSLSSLYRSNTNAPSLTSLIYVSKGYFCKRCPCKKRVLNTLQHFLLFVLGSTRMLWQNLFWGLLLRAGFELTILLPQSLECWNSNRAIPSYLHFIGGEKMQCRVCVCVFFLFHFNSFVKHAPE